jgi:hypothetical protein
LVGDGYIILEIITNGYKQGLTWFLKEVNKIHKQHADTNYDDGKIVVLL